jgi:hypothetical protein
MRARLIEQPAELGDDGVRVAAVVGDACALGALQVFQLALAGGELGVADRLNSVSSAGGGMSDLLSGTPCRRSASSSRAML